MHRQEIDGFELTACGCTLELVTVRRWPRVLALWRGARLVWRIEA